MMPGTAAAILLVSRLTQELPGELKDERGSNTAGKLEWEHHLVLCGIFKSGANLT